MSLLGFAFPVAIHSITFYNDLPWIAHAKNIFIFLFGILGCLAGSYTAIYHIIKTMQEPSKSWITKARRTWRDFFQQMHHFQAILVDRLQLCDIKLFFILIFLRVRRFVIFMLITMQSQFMLHVVTCFYVEFNMATYYCRCKTSKIASNTGLLLTAGTVLKLPLVACASTDFHRPTKLKIASCAHVLN